MGQTKITILCENTAGGLMGLTGEHGFSALIEKDGQRILFDTGQGMSLANNAQVIGINLTQVKRVILSHGHYDHTGGLPAVLYPPRGVEVIAHPDIFSKKYAELETRAGKQRIFIGIKYSQDYLEGALQARFNLIREFSEIAPGIFFSGEVPRETDFEHPDKRLKVKHKGKITDDPLLDDISLLIETDQGPVILLGCAHSGVVNIMNHFSAKTGHKKFHAVIGGTHLGFMRESGQQLEKSMDAFDDYAVDVIAVSHCTGQEAAAVCYNRFKGRFAFACAGWSKVF
ncbi:MAG: MBL fold metallo-hydrolase [Deltaproteobacteria bacterium]|nr:MBL fold metallo-hydrolase [Deltaproteobacteria bacterium]MBW1796042.1 MBL fold metallo-hydrolase [Deltaproteobacteria bacterium]